jgi:serine/threonine protein kinase
MAGEGTSLPHPTAAETSDVEQDPWIGRTLASYRVIRRIGWGGMGVVYQAQHISLERYAAFKFLAANLAVDKTYVGMFLREAKAAAKLNHPNIVAIYDYGSVGEDVYYLVMEFIEGRDFRTILREQFVLPVPEAIHYVRQVCSGLGYAHKKKIIHRDIKPENLMLTEDRIVKIGDLGLAKWMGEDSGSLTQTGLVMGSPFYIAPERLRGETDIDETTDVYSLGGTFFHLLTGKVPYEGTAPVVMAKHLESPIPNPVDVNPSLDARLGEIIMKMMAKDRKTRYQTMQEIDADLADYESSLSHPVMRAIPTKEQSSGTLEISEELAKNGFIVAGAKETPPKRPMTAGMIGVAAILICAALAWFFWMKPGSKTTEEPPLVPTVTVEAPAPKPKAVLPKAALPIPAKPEPAKAIVPPAPAQVAPPAPGSVMMLHDFEDGTEGWKVEQGFNMGGPKQSSEYAHSGKSSIVFRHYFKKDEESSAALVIYQKPINLSAYREIHAWVKVPKVQTQWTVQLYARSGKDVVQCWGKPYKAWEAEDWHLIKLDIKSIDFPKDVREISISVVNPGEVKAGIYLDQVEAIK